MEIAMDICLGVDGGLSFVTKKSQYGQSFESPTLLGHMKIHFSSGNPTSSAAYTLLQHAWRWLSMRCKAKTDVVCSYRRGIGVASTKS